MDVQDKVGRDLAKKMLERFSDVIQGDPAREAIIKNTKLYKYLSGKVSGSYSWKVSTGPNAGTLKTHQYVRRLERNEGSLRILVKIGIDQLQRDGKLKAEEYDRLKQMLDSPDEENLTMAIYIINQYRKKK